MKSPEEYNEIYFINEKLDLVDLIKEIQTEVHNEAIDKAAALVKEKWWKSKDEAFSKQSILELKI